MMDFVGMPEPTATPEAGVQPLEVLVDVTDESYKTNVTPLTERIALRLARAGLEHPVAAAVTIAMRGMSGLDRDAYAAELGVAGARVDELELGQVALEELPESVWRMVHEHQLEPVVLVDLEAQLRTG